MAPSNMLLAQIGIQTGILERSARDGPASNTGKKTSTAGTKQIMNSLTRLVDGRRRSVTPRANSPRKKGEAPRARRLCIAMWARLAEPRCTPSRADTYASSGRIMSFGRKSTRSVLKNSLKSALAATFST